MEQIEFFEYFINHKKYKIVKYKCVGVKVSKKLYKTKFYYADTDRYAGSQRLINIENFEKVRCFRILSFADDYEKYKQILLHEYAEMIEKNRTNVQKQEQFLEKLKSQN